MMRLKGDGVPIISFTWYNLIDRVDWDTALREENGRVNPLDLYDINREARPVGNAYKKLVNQWREKLPLENLCLDMNMPMDGGADFLAVTCERVRVRASIKHRPVLRTEG